VFHESLRRNDGDLARRHIGFVRHPFDTAIMVGVGMGIDHGDDRSPRPMLVVEVQSSSGGFGRKQRIDHDEPGVAFDQRHVRHIEPADLI
jgi:hypothetical protein